MAKLISPSGDDNSSSQSAGKRGLRQPETAGSFSQQSLPGPGPAAFDILSSRAVFGRPLDPDLRSTPEEGPPPGFDRPYTVQTMAEALQLLPERLRDGLLRSDPPAIVYAHYEVPIQQVGERGGVSFPASLKYARFLINDRKTERTLAIAEFKLFDFHQRLRQGFHSTERRNFVYLPAAIYDGYKAANVPLGPQEKALMGTKELQRVNEDIKAALKRFPFQLIAKEGFLHEVGGVLWHLLPEELQSKWSKDIYPLEPIPEIAGVYYRTRFYSRGDPGQFAEESFSDKFARFVLQPEGRLLDSVGRTLRQKDADFMNEVLAFFAAKQERGLLLHEVEPSQSNEDADRLP